MLHLLIVVFEVMIIEISHSFNKISTKNVMQFKQLGLLDT